MVSRLRPLNMNVKFEDRPSRLGQTIDITVAVADPRGCGDLRGGAKTCKNHESYSWPRVI